MSSSEPSEQISRVEYAELSLEALEAERRASERAPAAARVELRKWQYKKTQEEDLLPDVRVPPPPCPGFDRLDAIMSIQVAEPSEQTLINWG